jgi:small subunit ribosomal protein S20
LAHSPRGWTGARTPSAIKRVRQAQRKRAINQPRRTAAKTLVSKAVLVANDTAAGISGTPEEVAAAVQRAVSALDKAAKIGAIHRNAADRRKSRLMLKVNAALGGEGVAAPAKSNRQVGKAQAAKQAKARIAASRAVKAKGAQTAAGKARAALSRTSRTEGTESTGAAAATPAANNAPPHTAPQ